MLFRNANFHSSHIRHSHGRDRREVKAILARTALCALIFIGVLFSNWALAQDTIYPEQACAKIEGQFKQRIATIEEAVKPTSAQKPAWRQFVEAIKSAQIAMRAPCESGVTGIALKLHLIATAPEVMATVERAAQNLNSSLTPAQQNRLAKAME